jgi:hypothetical protein
MSFHGQTASSPENAGNGGSTEDVNVDSVSLAARRTRAPSRDASQLHICPTCGSDLVYPIDWAPADNLNWAVHLRCPDCEWYGHGVHDQQAVDQFDVELDRGTDMLIEDLSRLTRANMEEETERFISALQGDHILAEDF